MDNFCKNSVLTVLSLVIVMVMMFVVLNLLHPLCQSLQLLSQASILMSQAGHLLLIVPVISLPLLILSPALLHFDGVVWLHLGVILVTKQHLECEIYIYVSNVNDMKP